MTADFGMKLISLNVSRPKAVAAGGGQTVLTGIFKEPVQKRVMLRTLDLDGDGQADLTVHGGPDKAVYVYPFEHYDFWQRTLKREKFQFGQFGENFTVEGMSEDTVHIGDVYRVGSAVVQVTQPRLPCYKLALKMEMPTFPNLFLSSGRSGFYLRVLQEGEVGAGDEIKQVQADPAQLSVREVLHLAFFDKKNAKLIRKAAAVPALAAAWRGILADRLDT
jgi:MOSC domain-containing protein YiiM